jgi:hypothetical protein
MSESTWLSILALALASFSLGMTLANWLIR